MKRIILILARAAIVAILTLATGDANREALGKGFAFLDGGDVAGTPVMAAQFSMSRRKISKELSGFALQDRLPPQGARFSPNENRKHSTFIEAQRGR